MKTFFGFIFSALFLSQADSAVGATSVVDISDGLRIRNAIDLATQPVRPLLFDLNVKRRLDAWITQPKINNYIIDCQFRLRPFFQSATVLGPLCYSLRQPPSRRGVALQIIDRYVLEIAGALYELKTDPRATAQERSRATSLFAHFWDPVARQPKTLRAQMQECFQPALNMKYSNDGSYSFSPFQLVTSCLKSRFPETLVDLPSGQQAMMPVFSINLSREFRNQPGHAIAPTGWVAGNAIEYHVKNDVSEQMLKFLEAKATLVQKLYPLVGSGSQPGRGSLEAMMAAKTGDVFTEEEGFPSVANHPVWTQKTGIFAQLLEGMDSAQESIFIDIFFLGGSMGASFAKHLVTLMDRNPALKVFIIRDNVNHFGHREEMLPVFNFLLAESMRRPGQLVVTEAYIEGRKSGLPKFLQDLVTDRFLTTTGLQGHLDLYGRAQSDHSKVFVIDGTSENPVAFVGSKNLTDSSGAFCFDEVVEVHGPLAAVVLDDYYWDMKAALTQKMSTRYPGYLELLNTKGWSGDGQKGDANAMATWILRPFDLLGRESSGAATRLVKAIPAKGTVVARTGLNNLDSTRTSAVDQVIQAILGAKKNIFIKDQFLFDRNVVSALIRAKKSHPDLDVRVILEPLNVTTPAGLPNLLYLEPMTAAGIQIKWKLTAHTDKISQEFHMKTLSADGEYLISGSANKDPNTMYGAFREQQIEVFDVASVAIHDLDFQENWDDSSRTSAVWNKYDFKVPFGLKGLDGRELSPDEFIRLVRGIFGLLYDAQLY